MIEDIRVFDNFLPDPAAYRAAALALEYQTLEFPEATFHGIATSTLGTVPLKVRSMFPDFAPMISFFRKSPAGQIEPHYIHTDVDMGDWTAILYLNPDPPAGDGTAFWQHIASGAIGSAIPHERSIEGLTTEGWRLRRVVSARFNRLLVFPATFFHSRAIAANWGAGDDARLIQVVFGKAGGTS